MNERPQTLASAGIPNATATFKLVDSKQHIRPGDSRQAIRAAADDKSAVAAEVNATDRIAVSR